VCFFAMACVGSVSGVEPMSCALRALAGAAGVYVLSGLVGQLVLSIMVNAVISRRDKGAETKS
jgi:hypothetical protein